MEMEIHTETEIKKQRKLGGMKSEIFFLFFKGKIPRTGLSTTKNLELKN
jgi:hypothetical protein